MRNLVRGFALLCATLACVQSATALTTPPPLLQRPKLPKMVDARVNLKASFKRAQAARATKAKAGLDQARRQAAAIGAAVKQLQRAMPGLQISASSVTGGLTAVGNRRGALTDAAPGRKSEEIVRAFLSQHGDLYGLSAADLNDLVVLGDSAGGSSGLRMLRMEQQIDGLPVFQSETRFLLDRDGRLMKSLGAMVPHARSSAPQPKPADLLDPAEALARLLVTDGKVASAASFAVAQREGGRIELTAKDDDYVAGPVTARQVLFPLSPGLLVPAWSLVVFTTGEQDWYAMIDAQTGDLLWRKGIRDYASAHDARFRVYVQPDGVTPADSPAPLSPSTATPGSGTQAPAISPTIVSMHIAYDPVASQNGWIDDCPAGVCTANETQTLGNNVLACLDITQGANANICDTSTAGALDGNGRPTGNPDANSRNRDFLGTAPRDFQTNYLPPPQGGNPEAGQTCTGNGNNGTLAIDQFRRGAVTNLFYALNWYHDKLYELGFDEASGNYQQTNFSGMGLGGDRVLADVDDGSGTNNANFSTPPDGTSGRMQMYRFTGPTVDRDGSLDAEVYLHEATHGVSNRLVGNAAGLNWDPSGGMGEGWSDFVALSLLNNTNTDDPNGHYASGGYATYKAFGVTTYTDNYVYGIRRFPYTTDHSVNPMTWADVDDVTNDLSGGIAPDPLGFNLGGGAEVHNIGEIWALTLWGVRSRIIAGAGGDVPTGNHTMLQLVIDGLKMTPVDPNFTDARDAILEADCATNACANEDSIWGGFADRGLGYGAAEPYRKTIGLVASHVGIHESFVVPHLDVVDAATDVTLDDSSSNNNGVIDPGEAVKLTVKLTNPWRGAGKAVTSAAATLSTSTPGVTIYDNTATYGAIAPQGSATGDTFLITLSPSVVCGSSIDFTVITTSSLGTTSTTFSLRVGGASGTDAVVTYSATPNVAIPDNRPRGVFSQINVTDDFVIADLDFRVDSLTHTFVDDLDVMLRSPFGTGTDMIGLVGLNSVDGGSGDNLTNVAIDDDLPFTTANDLIDADAATHSPGYTGTWIPVYNSPEFANPAFFGVPAESVGLLTRFDGQSTKGTWSALAADEFSGDTGTLNSWSMLVTPVHFACTAFAPAVTITATKTVSGTFTVGGTITYTVTITNNGTANQADNTGHEFTDTLPAGLTLVTATATSGTPTTAANTVNWDGSLAPLGGSVTITITATINVGATGTISNQGTVSYDANGDGTNESTVVTDDPSAGGATDPTSFTLGAAAVTGTKTVSGTFQEGSTVTYTIVLSNSGSLPTADNTGNELTDTLPSGLTLTGASATSGVAAMAGNTVTWNGGIAAGGTVTITITATIHSGTAGSTISNQATFSYDSDGNGTNDATGTTDNPAVGGVADPTTFVVVAAPAAPVIPTLSEWGLLLLGLSLMAAAWSVLRRKAA